MRAPIALALAVTVAPLLAASSGCDGGGGARQTPVEAGARAAAQQRASSSPERALCLSAVQGDGAVEKTIRDAQRALAKNPKKADFSIVLGRAWIEKARNSGDPGYYLHADACAKDVLSREPDNVLALGLRSLALLNDHKFEEAKALAEEMLAKDRDDLTAWAALSDSELELGHIEAAERAAQELMDRKPSLPSYARASYLKWLRGDEPGALEAIRLAIDSGRGQKDHEPEAWVLSDAANIFLARGDVDGALAGYDKALAEKPDDAPALVGKARCLIARGRAADAVPLLAQAFDETHLVETAWWLARAYERLGDGAHAAAWLDKAVATGKEGDRRSLALVLATVNREIDVAQQAIDDDNAHRGGPFADDVAALVAWRAGRMADALARSEAAMKLGTPDPRLRLHRGVILTASGDAAAGRALIADALSKGAKYDPALVALANEVGVEVAQ